MFRPTSLLRSAAEIFSGLIALLTFLVLLIQFQPLVALLLLVSGALIFVSESRMAYWEFVVLDYQTPTARKMGRLFWMATYR